MLKNLTDHIIRIANKDGKIIAEIEPEGIICRAGTEFDPNFYIEINGHRIPTVKPNFKKITNLPQPEEGVFYIVSNIAFSWIKGRRDIIAPDIWKNAFFGPNGKIYAVTQFLSK